MASAPHSSLLSRAAAVRARRRAPLPRFVRHRALGTQALYEIVEERGALVTAAVLRAPGLEPGTRVRLLASDARAMERLEPAQAAALAAAGVDSAGIGSGPRAA